ncbi:MAG TPA: hypothetical protein PLO51_00345 [Candidatus Micrarchaeota archaeon]|nr:hypothetical protein [Candidatus Micrarchaeota archaeon]
MKLARLPKENAGSHVQNPGSPGPSYGYPDSSHHATTRAGKDSISISAQHNGPLSETYDSLLGFGLDRSDFSETRITCAKDLSTDPKSHLKSYELEFTPQGISISYLPKDGDKLAHAEAAFLLISFLSACPNYSIGRDTALARLGLAIEKSL